MLRIGTSSWNYDSWEGLIYDQSSGKSYLEQLSAVYDTAEIDRWFWSLFESPEARLPDLLTAEEYSRSIVAHESSTGVPVRSGQWNW